MRYSTLYVGYHLQIETNDEEIRVEARPFESVVYCQNEVNAMRQFRFPGGSRILKNATRVEVAVSDSV